MAEDSSKRYDWAQQKRQVVRSFVKSAGDTGKAHADFGGRASRISVDELGREQQRRSVAYSRARGVL